jgi:hypothetical protein
MADLREVRALAAMVYPSLAAHGYSTQQCVEQALDVAEKLVERSEARAAAADDVEARAALGNGGTGGRPLMPQRSIIAGT